MDCCAQRAGIEQLFGAKAAEDDLRRYRRKGPDPSTRLILEELRRWPLAGASLLDVGGGIGVLGTELLAAGAERLVHVDASPAYLEMARRRYAEGGWADRVRTVAGDFADLAEPLEPADVVTLDRVVCCYPDYRALLSRAARHARQALALSYPRNRWYVRAVIAIENFWHRIVRNPFRAFVHPPASLAAVLEGAGLRCMAKRGTRIWVVEVYRREGG